MASDNDSLEQLRDSIQAFEQACASRRRAHANGPPAAQTPRPAAPRRWWPWLILVLGLAAVALYLVKVGSPNTAGPGNRADQTGPAVRAESTPAAAPERLAASPSLAAPPTANQTMSATDDPPQAGAAPDTLPAGEPPQPGRFAIQVGAYERQAQAAALAERLRARNFPSYVASAQELEGRRVFRVRIGAYPDRAAAEAAGRRVADEVGLEWYLLEVR